MNDYKVSVTELKELYRAGAVSLPRGAERYNQAATEVNKTANNEGAGFHGDLGTSPALGAIQSYRNTIQNRIFVETSNNVVSAGGILCKIAEAFSQDDNYNKTELDKYQKELDTGVRVNEKGENENIPDDKLPPDLDKPPVNDNEPENPTKPGDLHDAPQSPGGPPGMRNEEEAEN